MRIRKVRKLTKDTKLVSGKNRIENICHAYSTSIVFFLVYANVKRVNTRKAFKKEDIKKRLRLFMGIRV